MSRDLAREAASSAELLQRIRAQMSEAVPWPERFGRLARAIAGVAGMESREAMITCQQRQENLELLVTDELAGLDVRQQHPALLTHLTECRDCRIAYSLLRDTLLAEREGHLVPIPAPQLVPPFLEPRSRRAPWRRQGGQPSCPFPLTFHIIREFISTALSGPQLALARGEIAEDGERKTLLLADVVPTEQGDLVAEVTIRRRVDRPEFIDLGVRLVSDWVLPSDLQVTLSWASLQRSETVTDEGEVHFRNLPLCHLTEQENGMIRADLTLTFART